jgi:hypothetical protein
MQIMKSAILFLAFRASVQAFSPSSSKPGFHAKNSSTKLRDGNIEQIEFKIYPDGRIEETVRGVKGGECHKITAEINKNLGKVTASKPTEELYEQEVVINQTLKVGSSDSKSGSGWEGSSSW